MGIFIKGESDLQSRRGPKRPPRVEPRRARATVMLATSLDAATLCPATCGHPPQYHPPQFGSPERKACATLCHSFTTRSYLSAIYPTAHGLTADEVDELFRSLHFYYDHGCSSDKPPCSHVPGVMVRNNLYDGLCNHGGTTAMKAAECTARHAHFAPSWYSQFDPGAGWLEVAHYNPDGTASGFLGRSLGVQYQYQRGSGIFYKVGRAKRATGKAAMLAELLLEVAGSYPKLEQSWPRVAHRLGFNASTAQHDSLLLRTLSTGKKSCFGVGIPYCRCGGTLPLGWDDAMVWAARGLGYETLLLSASLECAAADSATAAPGTITAHSLIIDVRPLDGAMARQHASGNFGAMFEGGEWLETYGEGPFFGEGTDNKNGRIGGTNEGGVAPGGDPSLGIRGRRKRADISSRWIEKMRSDNTLTLRDPMHLADDSYSRKCDFSLTSKGLSCAGHVSATYAESEWAGCDLTSVSCNATTVATATTTTSPAPSTTDKAIAFYNTQPSLLPSLSSPPPAAASWFSFARTDAASPPPSMRDGEHHHHSAVRSDERPTAIGGGSRAGAFYRFRFTSTSHSKSGKPADGIQLSEIKLFDAANQPIAVSLALNPNGERPVHHQAAPAAVDGSLQTKWFDASIVSRGESRVVLMVQSSAPAVASYQLFTANDNPRRDPTSWTLQLQTATGGGDGGSIWRTIDVADGVEPPEGRREAYGMRLVHPEGLHEAVHEEQEPGRA